MDEKGAYLIAQGLVSAEEYLRNPRDFEALLELPAISSNPAKPYRGAFGSVAVVLKIARRFREIVWLRFAR
jgi:hypothetical protein